MLIFLCDCLGVSAMADEWGFPAGASFFSSKVWRTGIKERDGSAVPFA